MCRSTSKKKHQLQNSEDKFSRRYSANEMAPEEAFTENTGANDFRPRVIKTITGYKTRAGKPAYR